MSPAFNIDSFVINEDKPHDPHIFPITLAAFFLFLLFININFTQLFPTQANTSQVLGEEEVQEATPSAEPPHPW